MHANMQRYSLASMVRTHLFGDEYSNLYPFVGCAMIVARSFARIHETNLKVRLFLLYVKLPHGMLYILRNKVFCLYGSVIKPTTLVLAQETP